MHWEFAHLKRFHQESLEAVTKYFKYLNRICKGKARYMCSEFGVCGFMTREREIFKREMLEMSSGRTPRLTLSQEVFSDS